MDHPTAPDFLLLRYFDTVYLIPVGTGQDQLDLAPFKLTDQTVLKSGLSAKELIFRTQTSPFLDGLAFAGAYSGVHDATSVRGPTDGSGLEDQQP